MDLRQLRYFLAVVDELHFTRAAQKMHVAQPALSAQIRSLEREIGGELFVRSTRNVTLTKTGEVLAPQAAEIVAAADRALAEARSEARRQAMHLAVGCLGAPGEVVPHALDELAEKVANAQVDVRTFDFVELWDALADGTIDLAFAYLPANWETFTHLFGRGDLEVIPVMDEPRVVVLSSTHPLAVRETIAPADLAAETFVTHPDSVPQAWRDFWLLADELDGERTLCETRARDVEQWLHLIERGQGIDTCPAYVARYYSWPGLSYVPLEGAPQCTFAVLRRVGNRSPLGTALLDSSLVAAEHL